MRTIQSSGINAFIFEIEYCVQINNRKPFSISCAETWCCLSTRHVSWLYWPRLQHQSRGWKQLKTSVWRHQNWQTRRHLEFNMAADFPWANHTIQALLNVTILQTAIDVNQYSTCNHFGWAVTWRNPWLIQLLRCWIDPAILTRILWQWWYDICALYTRHGRAARLRDGDRCSCRCRGFSKW